MAERRKRITPDERLKFAAFLRDLPVDLDIDTVNQAWTTTAQLAERWRLAIYDAAYLELAPRLDLPLATRDKELRTAAQGAGVALL